MKRLEELNKKLSSDLVDRDSLIMTLTEDLTNQKAQTALLSEEITHRG